MFEGLKVRDVESKINEFDKMKFIDEDGKEKISGRELAKALGYSDWRNFKAAVKRTNDQIKNIGKEDEQIVEVTRLFNKGNNAKQNGSDYNLTRKQAINVANNADTSKPQVAMVQEWLYDTSEVGEKALNIYNKLKDRQYIEDRAALSISNKNFSRACLEHNVETNELGVMHNACDEALYHMSTNEIKKEYGKSNRPKADFLGSVMCSAESFAKSLSGSTIEEINVNGLDECSEIATKIHGEVRSIIINNKGKAPEQLITGEDVKKTERRYKKLTKEQLKAIEQEF